MKASEITIQEYAPDTRLDMPVTMGVEYSLATVTVVFELANRLGEVLFRYRTGEDAQMSIAGQVVTIAIEPTTASLDEIGNTLNEAMTLAGFRTNVEFNLDFNQTGSETVDYRIQGEFDVLKTHGFFE